MRNGISLVSTRQGKSCCDEARRLYKQALAIIANEDDGAGFRPTVLSITKVKITQGKPEIDAWLQGPAEQCLLAKDRELGHEYRSVQWRFMASPITIRAE